MKKRKFETSTNPYLSSKDLRNLTEAHNTEINELREEIQQLTNNLMKLTLSTNALMKHVCFEFALRPVSLGVTNVGK